MCAHAQKAFEAKEFEGTRAPPKQLRREMLDGVLANLELANTLAQRSPKVCATGSGPYSHARLRLFASPRRCGR